MGPDHPRVHGQGKQQRRSLCFVFLRFVYLVLEGDLGQFSVLFYHTFNIQRREEDKEMLGHKEDREREQLYQKKLKCHIIWNQASAAHLSAGSNSIGFVRNWGGSWKRSLRQSSRERVL